MKNIAILGSTGSIGVSTLDVIGKNPSRFKALALAGGRNFRLLNEQIKVFKPKIVSVLDQRHAEMLQEILSGEAAPAIVWGDEGYQEVASLADVGMVVSAIVGAAGLRPTVAAIAAGKDIALANKETMVMAGSLVVEQARRKGVRILPVDSEHSAIFQCLQGHRKSEVRRIILTASGGPFFRYSHEQLKKVTLSDALKHPTWEMGRKITIDSATLMNKGLEVIEARWLFDIEVDRIDVHVHPQSIVHSMVEYCDGSVIAQMGLPDMRGPIAYALNYPDRVSADESRLDLCAMGNLEFFAPDCDKFPCLRLAYEAARKGGTAPVVLNASNEVAVEHFIKGTIPFNAIPAVVAAVLSVHRPLEPVSIAYVLEADREGRNLARELIERKKLQF